MSTVLAALAVVCLLARLLLLGYLHLRPGDVRPVRHPVSDYAVSDRPATRRATALMSRISGVGWALLGCAVLALPGAGGRGTAGLLLALGAVQFLLPAVPTDGAGRPVTARGRLHLLLAVVSFTLAFSVIRPLQVLLGEGSGTFWGVLGVLHTVAAAALAALVISLLVPALRERTFGLSERLFLLTVAMATLVAAVGLAGGGAG